MSMAVVQRSTSVREEEPSMRVVLLQNFVAPYRVPLYEGLQDRLSEFKVFASTPMEDDREWVPDWGTIDVEIQRSFSIRYRVRENLGFRRTLQVHFPYDTLARLFRFRPDAVITVELGVRSLQVAIYKLLRPSVRLLIWCKLSEHTERSWGAARLLVRRFILSKADGVMVNGESGARYIARLGVPDERIFRVNQPVDVDAFTRTGRSRPVSARTRLLCSGSLIERKGVLPFLGRVDVWARANPTENLEIWWLGDGKERAALEAFATAPNLSQRFIGSVPYASLPQWYSQADILAFPTLSDEWGLVVNEAMAAGLPVLGSIYAQAVTELVSDGETGWIFDPTSDQSVQMALDRVRDTSPEDLARMRDACRRRIASVTPDAAAEKIFNALRGVAGPAPVQAITVPLAEMAEANEA
jgi:glycosyltransferase involved in cell wall biosynthesis